MSLSISRGSPFDGSRKRDSASPGHIEVHTPQPMQALVSKKASPFKTEIAPNWQQSTHFSQPMHSFESTRQT